MSVMKAIFYIKNRIFFSKIYKFWSSKSRYRNWIRIRMHGNRYGSTTLRGNLVLKEAYTFFGSRLIESTLLPVSLHWQAQDTIHYVLATQREERLRERKGRCVIRGWLDKSDESNESVGLFLP